MTRKLKPVEVDLSDEVQKAVLSLPVEGEDGSLTTVGLLVKQAAQALARANDAIQGNALILLTASHLMKEEKRRGTPTIGVRLDGSAYLRVVYGGDEVLKAPQALAPRSSLPSLGTLRARAEELKVDISDLGRKKRRIMRRLDEAKQVPESVLVGGVSIPLAANPA